MPTPRKHDELAECRILVTWLNFHRIKFSHLAQSTFTRTAAGQKNWGIIARNKQLGVQKGVPDYMIILPRGLLFIEMKSAVGKASKEQVEWIEALNKINSVEAAICYSAKEAIKLIESILK